MYELVVHLILGEIMTMIAMLYDLLRISKTVDPCLARELSSLSAIKHGIAIPSPPRWPLIPDALFKTLNS